MTINAFDVDSYNKGGFDFGQARQAGFTHCYIKLGGDNIDTGRYVMSSNGGYHGYVSRAASAGIVPGSYWVTGPRSPAGSAQYVLANWDPASAFYVCDNETLDDGGPWNPSQCYEHFQTMIVGGVADNFMYASRLGPWAEWDFTRLADLGVKAIVADYGSDPLSARAKSINYPAELVVGHQYTSSGSLGGLSNIDLNLFADNAFGAAGIPGAKSMEDGMRFVTVPEWGGQCYVCGWGFIQYIGSPAQLDALLNVQYGNGDLSHIVTLPEAQVRIVLDGLGLGNVTNQELHDLPATPPQIRLSGMFDAWNGGTVTVDANAVASIVSGVTSALPAAQGNLQITGTITAEGKAA